MSACKALCIDHEGPIEHREHRRMVDEDGRIHPLGHLDRLLEGAVGEVEVLRLGRDVDVERQVRRAEPGPVLGRRGVEPHRLFRERHALGKQRLNGALVLAQGAQQHRKVAERGRITVVLERRLKGVPRKLKRAARPEALSEAVPCVEQRWVQLDCGGKMALGAGAQPPLVGGCRGLAAQVEKPCLHRTAVRLGCNLHRVLRGLSSFDCRERAIPRKRHPRGALLLTARWDDVVEQRVRRVDIALGC